MFSFRYVEFTYKTFKILYPKKLQQSRNNSIRESYVLEMVFPYVLEIFHEAIFPYDTPQADESKRICVPSATETVDDIDDPFVLNIQDMGVLHRLQSIQWFPWVPLCLLL